MRNEKPSATVAAAISSKDFPTFDDSLEGFWNGSSFADNHVHPYPSSLPLLLLFETRNDATAITDSAAIIARNRLISLWEGGTDPVVVVVVGPVVSDE